MKAEILKIAGVKSDKEFYKKYPTEEEFMKVHKKEFKKAQMGVGVMKSQTPYKMQQFQMPNLGGQAPNVQVPYAQGYVPLQNAPQQLSAPKPLSSFQTIDPQAIGGMQNMTSFNRPSTDEYMSKLKPPPVPAPKVDKKSGSKLDSALGNIMPSAGKIIEGIQAIKEEKKAVKRAQQAEQVSDVALQASRTRPEQVQRRYVRPEDQQLTGEEMFPIYGVGTNVLAKNGAEIANTYAPNTLYDDLGYEPLNDSVKQYYFGGDVKKANFGSTMTSIADAGGGDVASELITAIGGENAGGNLGGTIGGTIGSFFGPAGKMIGQVGGQLVGALIDKNPQKIKKAQDAAMANVTAMGFQNGAQASQIQNSSFMKDGGIVDSDYEWVSHTWQPQVIASFGEHKMSDLLRPDRTMDTLRAGGHLKEYTDPSEEAMSTERMAMGGELKTHWGGYAEPMSYNPYLPDGGEMVMFRGQSHDESDGKGRTGIGVTYGENPVEVERGEPAVKLQDGGSVGDSMHVFGNVKINKGLASLLENQKIDGKSISGMKFKSAAKLIGEKTSKQNKMMDGASTKLSSMDLNSPFDKLSFNTQKAIMDGGDQKLKNYANQTQDLAMLQNAVNSSEEEKLMKITNDGDIATAKNGIAQSGTELPTLDDSNYNYLMKLYKEAEKVKTGPAVLKFQKEYHRLAPEYAESVIGKYPVTSYGKEKGITAAERESNEDSIFGKRTKQYMAALQKKAPKRKPEETIPTPRTMPILKTPDILAGKPLDLKSQTPPVEKSEGLSWMDYFNQVLPYLRPSDAEPLDPNQLYGEMNALANNQLEPVRAQTFQPELGVPYDISYQDILNQNQADYRSQQRMAGYNPAAQSILNAQKYGANEKVLGEQFRANQAMKDKVYGENRNIINQSKLQNLGILDNQYVRQEQAKSNTKAVKQAALDSISAKYAQNKLENRTLQVYENQYNYRYDPRFRAMNMNPLAQFNVDADGETIPVRDENGRIVEYRTSTTNRKDKLGYPAGSSQTVTQKTKSVGKNGFIVKALKNI
jgi:hypothetical protein